MAREYKKTEKQMREHFRKHEAPSICDGLSDKPALREAFNIWVDSLHRAGELTDYQAENITYPPEYN